MRAYKVMAAVLTGALLIGTVFLSLRRVTANQPVMADVESYPTIIVDPGHGGLDGGAMGADGIVEKDINLAICLTLRDMLQASGFQVVMTRDTDISIHDEGVTGTRKQKTSDLNNRLDIVDAHPDAIFISIHQNKFTGSSSKGAQMFYSANNPESQRLASLLQENFAGNLQPGNTRQIKRAGKNLYLMYKAKCPAVLIECGFLSNPEEARMLTEAEFQNKIAFTTYASVLSFLDIETPGAGSNARFEPAG